MARRDAPQTHDAGKPTAQGRLGLDKGPAENPGSPRHRRGPDCSGRHCKCVRGCRQAGSPRPQARWRCVCDEGRGRGAAIRQPAQVAARRQAEGVQGPAMPDVAGQGRAAARRGDGAGPGWSPPQHTLPSTAPMRWMLACRKLRVQAHGGSGSRQRELTCWRREAAPEGLEEPQPGKPAEWRRQYQRKGLALGREQCERRLPRMAGRMCGVTRLFTPPGPTATRPPRAAR